MTRKNHYEWIHNKNNMGQLLDRKWGGVCSPFSEPLKMYVAIDDFAYRKGHIQWVSHTKDDGQKDDLDFEKCGAKVLEYHHIIIEDSLIELDLPSSSH